jgi:hypothetical protein
MSKTIRIVAAIAVVLGAAYIVFLDFAFGGFEKYQPSFEIVVPQSTSGVVCATSRPGTVEDIKHTVRHEVTSQGLLEVDGDILRSHRPIKLFIRTASTNELREIPSSRLMPIFTENDTTKGQWYTVMWLGSSEDWDTFRKAHPNERFCLGRFEGERGK